MYAVPADEVISVVSQKVIHALSAHVHLIPLIVLILTDGFHLAVKCAVRQVRISPNNSFANVQQLLQFEPHFSSHSRSSFPLTFHILP